MPTVNVSCKSLTVDVPAETPILWTLRDEPSSMVPWPSAGLVGSGQ
jgi:hypothetical protein